MIFFDIVVISNKMKITIVYKLLTSQPKLFNYHVNIYFSVVSDPDLQFTGRLAVLPSAMQRWGLFGLSIYFILMSYF